MTSSIVPLPTLPSLGVTSVPAVDADQVASEWLASFASAATAGKIDDILALFVPEPWFRDMLALTWDFRTFRGAPQIRAFLGDRLAPAAPSAFALTTAKLETPYPDIAWIQARFTFETKIGLCSGIVRLVPTQDGTWKGWTFYTNLEDLKAFPEKVGARRNFQSNHGKWAAQREAEKAFADREPEVLIVGGGQSGLEVAARLKMLGVSALVVEKNARVGDLWRKRYQALCLHDPVWYDHLPYMPFPDSWPVYTPAQKLANWLEHYAEAMEIDVWTSSTVTRAEQGADKRWSVTVQFADGTEGVLHAAHIVFAIGLGGNNPYIPNIPGKENFKGLVLHSTQHNSAKDHAGKKVVVVGAATTAHDVCADYAEHGVDITMYQRDSTFIMTTKEGMPGLFGNLYWEGAYDANTADRVDASFPVFVNETLAKRATAAVAEADKVLLDGLHKVGFRTHLGPEGTGAFALVRRRCGGYYFDVGASQMIVDGKIKLKSGSAIKRFVETGLEFEDGTTLDADVVFFATGLGSPVQTIRQICGDGVADRVKPIWNLDDEGEMRGVWRDSGVENLWVMIGNLAMCRFYSKHVALQIKAIEEGLFGPRYVR